MTEHFSNSKTAQPPIRASIVRKLLLTFFLLVAVIIFNSIYSAVKENRALLIQVQKSMGTKLETVSAILNSDLEKFTMIAGIVREQRVKVLHFLDYENYRSIQIMLQTVASKYDLDRIFFLNEYKELLLTDMEILTELPRPDSFQELADDRLLGKTALATVPAAFFREKLGEKGLHGPSQATRLCMQAVVPIHHDLGDIYGYIVLVKAVDNNPRLADTITRMADTSFVIYNDQRTAVRGKAHVPILSNFPNTAAIPFPEEGMLSFGNNSYLSQTKDIVDISGQPIAHLSVLRDSNILRHERKRHLANSLPPFIAAILISILLFFIFQKLIINRIYQLISVLQSMGTRKQKFDIRLPVHGDGSKFDELDLMYLHFNDMMDQLQSTYDKLEVARRAAETANTAKSDFLANMSHEIRTPMNAIIGLTDLMISQGISHKQRNNLQIIKSSSESLLNIINDILDFSKIEAGMMRLEQVEFHLQDVLDPLVDLFSEKCARKKLELLVTLDKNVPAAIIGDPLKLRQVMINLVANAIKFTEQGEIIIRVRCPKETAHSALLVFSVQDSGIGIQPEEIDNLFTAFTQADGSHSRRYGGTGLGLAICKQIVNLMGGSIEAVSAPGEGSIFTFSGEFTTPRQEKESGLVLPQELQHLRTLVVDDNENVRQVMTEVLSFFSLRVTATGTGKEALALLKGAASAEPFQLIIIDWVLEKKNGAALAKEIQSDPQLRDTPILLMSGFKDARELSQSEAAAIDGFMKKPVKNSVLINSILTIFGRDRLPPDHDIHLKPEAMAEQKPGSRIVILVVEDNLINQQVARELLESAGTEVHMAGNGQEALNMLYEKPTAYDVVLMDIQMPDMDGFEATRLIRQNKRFRTLPIIAMTAHATDDDRIKSMAAGMDDHLTKPIRKDDLLAAINGVIKDEDRIISGDAPSSGRPAVTGSHDFPATAQGLDLERGLKTVNNNITLYKKLLMDFCRDHSDAPRTVAAALGKDNREKARQLVHTIKGLSGNLAAGDLHQAASELESVLKDSAEDPQPALDRFTDIHDKLMHSLQAQFPETGQGTAPESHPSGSAEIESVLQKLSLLIKLHDTDVEEFLESRRNTLETAETQELLRTLSSQLSRFDFPAAAKSVEELKGLLNIQLEGEKR